MKLDYGHIKSEGKGSAAENVEFATVQISCKGDNRRYDKGDADHHGQSKGEKPTACRHGAYEHQIGRHRSKTAGGKDDGVRLFKPKGQYKTDVDRKDCAHNKGRPTDSAAASEVGQQDGQHGKQTEKGYGEHNEKGVCPTLGRLSFREKGVCVGALLGKKDGGFTKGADLFGVGKTDTAFHTIHQLSPRLL